MSEMTDSAKNLSAERGSAGKTGNAAGNGPDVSLSSDKNGPNGPDNGQAKQSDAPQSKDLTLLRGREKRNYIIEEKLNGRRTKDIAHDLGVHSVDVSRIWSKNIGNLVESSRFFGNLVDNHIANLNDMTQESIRAFMDASKERKLDMLPHLLKSKDSVISALMRGQAPQSQTNIQLNADKVEGFQILDRDGNVVNEGKAQKRPETAQNGHILASESNSIGQAQKSSKIEQMTPLNASVSDSVGPFELGPDEGDSRD